MAFQDRNSRTLHLPDGRKVGLAEYGAEDGRPVLALHGAPACRLMFAIADEEARRAGLRLIAPDRPGYGLTPPDEKPTLASRTDWLAAIVDVLGLDRFAILAVSGGGPYATALASRLQTRITALALVSPMGPAADYLATPLAREAPIPFLQRRFFVHLPRRWFFPALGRTAVRLYMTPRNGLLTNVPRLIRDPDAGILERPLVREVMGAMTREAFRTGAEGGISDMMIYAARWDVPLSSITAPSILWQGTADRIVPVAAAYHLAHSIPGCHLRRIGEAGHFWVFEHVGAVCEELAGMIANG
jgi:pimeloyl-ACP methyl ester carboxylesterase